MLVVALIAGYLYTESMNKEGNTMNTTSPVQARFVKKIEDLGHIPEVTNGFVSVEVADFHGYSVEFTIFSYFRTNTNAWSTEYRIFNEYLGESGDTPRSSKKFWADWDFYTN